MHVRRTVVAGAFLLDPSVPAPGHAGPVEPVVEPDGFRVRRRARLPDGEVHGLQGDATGPVLVGVPRGTGYAVVVDPRPDSGTFGRLAASVLDGTSRHRLLVPAGCLYGVQAHDGRALVEIRAPGRTRRDDRLTVDPDDGDLALRWLRPRPSRSPGAGRSWTGLCTRLGAPTGPRRDRVSIW